MQSIKKIRSIGFQWIGAIFLFFLCLFLNLGSHEDPASLTNATSSSLSNFHSPDDTLRNGNYGDLEPQKVLQMVSSLGASTSGYWVEACVGSRHKGCRHRFHCHHSNCSTDGFLGPHPIAKPLSLKDQPGIFPAPIMGDASLTFKFKAQNPQATHLTPIVIRPDGTAFQTPPMTPLNSLQTLVIPSQAQTGIYTLFVIAHPNTSKDASVSVEATISTQPQNCQIFHLFPFDPTGDGAKFSAEFIYKK